MAEDPLARLSLATLGRVPAEHRPQLDPGRLSIGVVHLGIGAFSRAHPIAYLERAAELTGDERWGVCGFSQRSSAAAETLAAQDGCYSLRLAAPGSETIRVLVSLREARFAQQDPAAVVGRLADPRVRLVTLTVTEKGYRHDPATKRLRRDDAELLADAAGRPPTTVIGQLVRALEARRAADAGPLTVASCDNLPANGELLAGLVEEFLQLPGSFSPGLAAFVGGQVSFPSSMVDRIVPATTPEDLARAAGALEMSDEAAVVAEPFGQWVIEDRFAAERPALERAGVEVVGDVAPYETLKLRVLNGSHSALAYLGVLAGVELIAEAVSVPALERFVRALADFEVAPTLVLPAGVDFGAYRDQVLGRFSNPLLAHRCRQVASDGSQKLPQRLLATARSRLAAGTLPRRCALVVAAYVRAVCHGCDDAGRSFEVSDPLAATLRRAVGERDEPSRIAERALGVRAIFGEDLAADERFGALVAEALAELAGAGAIETAARYAAGGG